MKRIIFDENIYEEVVEKGIKRAQRSVWLSTANVKNMMVRIDKRRAVSIIDIFEDLITRGVDVRILHSGVPSGQFIEQLKRKKSLIESPLFTMKKCVRTHFKCVRIDSSLLFISSANLTGAGLGMKGKNRRNFEMGILTDEDLLLDIAAGYFDAIWSGERCRTCARKKVCIVPLEQPE